MAETSPIILHHFDQSPFSEKIRKIFGFKGIRWHSVIVSRIAPKPDLIPLTGGYRRTPNMQIGADIYCDTRMIALELERRFPTPTLFPDDARGMAQALSMWSDRVFFPNTVSFIFGSLNESVPRSFIEDRSKLRGMPFDVKAMHAMLPQLRDQFRAHLSWIDAQLADGREWLFKKFSLADVNAYMNIWYVRAHGDMGDTILAQFTKLLQWEKRMHDLGHGERVNISAVEALQIAASTEPQSPVFGDPDDPNGRKPGDFVNITPDDQGKISVSGEIVSLSAQHIAIRRRDERVGNIIVHFPRAGFQIISA